MTYWKKDDLSILSRAMHGYGDRPTTLLQRYLISIYHEAGVLEDEQRARMHEMMDSPDPGARSMVDDILSTLNKQYSAQEIFGRLNGQYLQRNQSPPGEKL